MGSVAPHIAVAAGGALGSVARYLLSLGALGLLGPVFPWGTLAVNALGSFLIGLLAALTLQGGRIGGSPAARHFAMTGFCGGFTTFSLFSLESLLLWTGGASGLAIGYVLASLALWLTACWAGLRLGRCIIGATHAAAASDQPSKKEGGTLERNGQR